ncbi:MAG: alpha-glucan family phosphorylase [Flavobacteriales bacterium]
MTSLPETYKHPYNFDKKYSKSVAYFCMDYAIDQSLKTYSGGLGFLAGSHMKSAYDLKQNLIGIGILWKYGYYDQVRKPDQTMDVLFQEKIYNFLVDTNIKFTIKIDGYDVWIKAYFLKPEIFGTVPIFFLSTDVAENDYLAKTTTYKLYDSDPRAKIAQTMVLGLGGAKLLDQLNYQPEVYHLNEAHAISAIFHEYGKIHNPEEIKKKFVFTTHTPVEAGNEKHDINLLNEMGFFGNVPLEEVRKITGMHDDIFNHTLATLRLSRKANGVSKLHGKVAREMWGGYDGICEIDHVTNAQHANWWTDKMIKEAVKNNDVEFYKIRKRRLKEKLFEDIADQTGQIFNPEILTFVWARRFADYKRADLLTRDVKRFRELLERVEQPVQIIWAGKPYPMDYNAVGTFNKLVHLAKEFSNMAVLVGYELKLSRKLKEGSDVWLNTPRVTREASGTSGMTAAMNGSVNVSTNDGWICEFIKDGENGFVLPTISHSLPFREQDQKDMDNLFDVIEHKVIPAYYNDKGTKWQKIVNQSMHDVVPFFGSDRFSAEYYDKMY